MENIKDPQLWEIARRRVSFRSHLITYMIIIGFFWALLWIQGGDYDGFAPWPIWPTLGWGIGLAFHYMGAYVYPKENSVKKEYEKLLREKLNSKS